MRSKRLQFCFIVPILALSVLTLAVVPVWSQSSSGSVRGTVMDETKGVIPGADVTLTNVATNVPMHTITNDVGIYVFPVVAPGQYRLAVDQPGMQKYEATLTVQVQQVATIDVAMKVGEVTTQVLVQDVTPIVTADNPTLGHVLERQRIEQLPINGRNLKDLLQTVPGLDVNGTRASGLMVGTSDYILDGAAMSDPLDGSGTLVRPAGLDTIQEFNVSVNATSAKFARPTNVVISTRSGGNQLHGSLFETNRNNGYGVARTRDNTSGAKPTFLNRNEYGGTAGGPVWIPGIYNGKDKTFWFFSFEQMKLRNPLFKAGRVPTMAMRQGDFSELKDSQGRLYEIYDPWTTNPTTWERQQAMYNGRLNVFDPSRISPLARYMFSVIPEPTFPDRNPLIINNYEGAGRQFTDQWTTTIRVDHTFSEKDQVYGRYLQGHQNAQTMDTTPGRIPMLDEVANFTRRPNYNRSLALSWVHTFSPTLFNEVLASGSREHSYGVSGDPTVDYNAELGLPNPFGVMGFPTVFSNIMQSGNYFQGYNAKAKWFNFFVVDDNMTKIAGRHELQFGAHIRYDQLTILPQQRQAGGVYNFGDASYTGLFDPAMGTNNPAATSFTGHAIANTFLGLNNYRLYMRKGKYYIRAHENALYLQDNFKATSRLTLNLGLRWEFTPFPADKNNVMSSFDVASKSVVLGQPLETLYKMNVTLPSVIARQEQMGAKFVTYDQVGLPRKMVRDNWKDIGPRLGFAYQAFDGAKTFVVRAGYALSYYPDPYFAWNDRHLGSAPFSAEFNNNIYSSSAFSPDGKQRYGMRSVPTLIAGSNSRNAIDMNNASSIARGTVEGYFFAEEYPTSRVHNWNLTLEKEILPDTLARVSLVGNHGAKQSQMLELNDPTPDYVHYMTTHEPLPQGEFADVALRPLDQSVYGEIGEYMKTGHSNYNGVQFELERRYSRGVRYQVSYVIGNAFRDGVGGYSPGGGGGWESIIPCANQFLPGLAPADVDERNRLLNYQRDFSLPKHRVRWNWTADLPFGKGKWLAGNLDGFWGGLADKVIGGWQFSGMGHITSSWFRVTDSNDYWPTGNPIEFYGNKYPILDCTGGEDNCIPGYLWWNGYIPSNKINTPDGYRGIPANYKPAVAPLIPWGAPAPADMPAGKDLTDLWDTSTVFIPLNNGDVAETTYAPGIHPFLNRCLPGPFTWNLDVALAKQFQIGEGKQLRVTVDAFNLFNHPTVGPDPAINFANYMDNGILYMNGQTNTPRQLQLGLRLVW